MEQGNRTVSADFFAFVSVVIFIAVLRSACKNNFFLQILTDHLKAFYFNDAHAVLTVLFQDIRNSGL